LREKEDADALIEALNDGIVDVIATDHAPHSPLEKDCEFSSASPGMMGLELCLPLLFGLVREERLKVERLVSALSTAPAKIAGLEVPKIAEGAAADLVLFDPEVAWTPARSTLQTKSLNSPFVGKKMIGRVMKTMVGGNIVFETEELS
jgi:dihydroorotase